MAQKRSYPECDALMCAKGSLFEMEDLFIDGKTQRVWKNVQAWPAVADHRRPGRSASLSRDA